MLDAQIVLFELELAVADRQGDHFTRDGLAGGSAHRADMPVIAQDLCQLSLVVQVDA
jgi:hypothetical protein